MKVIYIVSPSSPNVPHSVIRRERAINFLKTQGYKIIRGKLLDKTIGHTTGTISERVTELNDAFKSNAQIIYASFGGENSSSLLDKIDYAELTINPKIIIGNSDITAILLAIYAKIKLPTWHFMTLLPAFGEFEPMLSQNYNNFNQIIMSQNADIEYFKPTVYTNDYINWNQHERPKKVFQNQWIGLNDGVASGVLLGGNLKTIVKLLGSEYLPSFKKVILVLEDSVSSPEIVESCIASLANSGAISSIIGLIICKCENYLDQSRDYGDDIYQFFKNYDVPIFKNFDSAHTYPCLPIKIGGVYFMSVKNNDIRLILKNKGYIINK
ncbi:MAG: LD-carboxypeptidase [Firmicutes bacterium]|nr:LD-carboxypeptidase [Bacillota bacterium]